MAPDRRCWILLGFVIFVVVTNAGIARPPTGDAIDYRVIASAAPGLPHQEIGSAYTGRFATHYLVGTLSSATGMSLDAAYLLGLTAVLVALVATVHVLLRHRSTGEYVVGAGLFVMSPYVLRPYLLEPALLQDLVFVIGLGVCLGGLRFRAARYVIIGLVIAVLGRQSAVAVAPVAAVWMLTDPEWRRTAKASARIAACAAALVVTAGCYAAIRVATASFTTDYEPSLLRDSVVNRLGDLPGAAPELAAHVARTVVPLVVPLAVIVTFAILVGLRRIGFRTWGTLLVAASIVAQPLMIDPAWVGFAHNEQRLSALALLPLALAAAELLSQWRRKPLTGYRIAVLTVLLAIGSLHHEFSFVGPPSLTAFLVVQVIIAAAITLLAIRDNAPPVSPLLGDADRRTHDRQS